MSNITRSEALKKIRKVAKGKGLVFKKEEKTRNEDGSYRWNFCDRETGFRVMQNNFWTAYANCMSGYVSSWNGTEFTGISQ